MFLPISFGLNKYSMEHKTVSSQFFSIKKSQPILVQPGFTKTNDEPYFLSNLDLVFVGIIPTVYIYKPQEAEKKSKKDVCNVIKEALAKVLVSYYPLAGSLSVSDNGKLIVKCTNEGVPFVEAEGDCDIDVLGDITIPDPTKLMNLVHTIPDVEDIVKMPLLTVQVTRFRCGGFTLGLGLNHCMADGISAMEFVNSWAETARGVPLTTPPSLDRRALESRQPPLIKCPHEEVFTEIEDISGIANQFEKEKFTVESFTFDQERIAALKKIAMHDGAITSCTSFTALVALIWRSSSKALKKRPDQKVKLLFVVDGRSKLDPPLPRGYFGNGIVLTSCVCTAGELTEKPLSFAVEMVQNGIKKVTGDYIRSMIDFIEVNRGARPCHTTALDVASWARLDFDSANFGWGNPEQSGCPMKAHKEFAYFLPIGKNERKGLTFLMGLPETAMKSFKECMQV